MTFGWYGWTFEHPDDWAPTLLSGDRKEGLVRLNAPDGLVAALRWSTGKPREDVLDRYRARLERDARKAKKPFDFRADGDRFRFTGAISGVGTVVRGDRRSAVLEIQSERGARLKSAESVLRSLNPSPDGERWAVLGLEAVVPAGYAVSRRQFYAGRTVIELTRSSTHVALERWGMAESLLAERSLADWLVARLGGATATGEGDDAVAEFPRHWGRSRRVLARHQPDRNQIMLADVSTRRPADLLEATCLTS